MKKAALMTLLSFSLFSFPAYTKTLLDVLVLYTPAATTTTEGSDINARVTQFIEYSNQIFINSQINAEYRLVGLEEYQAPFSAVTYTALDQLRTDTYIQQRRNDLGADFVMALTPLENSEACGLGYVTNGTNGNFYAHSKDYAYSVVAINCGLNVFAHELGHNLGLGHSERQTGAGGIWSWARGYGVDGLFTTVMAYPSNYGINKQVAIMSNPDLYDCEGIQCGVDRNSSNGADASFAVNQVLDQLADFRPTKIAQPVAEEQPSTGSPVPCVVDIPANNLTNNPTMENTADWLGNLALIETVTTSTGCVESILKVTDRGGWWSGVSTRFAVPADVYQFNVRATLGLKNEDNTRHNLSVLATLHTTQ